MRKRDRKENACFIKEVFSMSNWKLLLPGNSEKWCKTHFSIILSKGKGSQRYFWTNYYHSVMEGCSWAALISLPSYCISRHSEQGGFCRTKQDLMQRDANTGSWKPGWCAVSIRAGTNSNCWSSHSRIVFYMLRQQKDMASRKFRKCDFKIIT